MNKIDYLGKTEIYTGSTTDYTFYSPDIYKGQTLLIFIQCSSAGLNADYPPDWILVDKIDTTMSMEYPLLSIGTIYCFYCQPKKTLIQPSWVVNGLSPNFNSGYGLIFSGVTLIQSQVINAYTHSINSSIQYGTNGFTTTINNSLIVQSSALMRYPIDDNSYYFNTNSWNSDPYLTWIDIYSDVSAIKTSTSGYSISHGCGISNNVSKGKYFSFSYTTNSNYENLTIDVALSPVGSKPNMVLNGLESF